MKFLDNRPYAQPEAAARKLVEIAAGIKPTQEDRIFIELVNWPFLTEFKGSPPEFGGRPALRHRAGLVLDARVRNLFAGVQAGGLT
jgi:hypothetical protein